MKLLLSAFVALLLAVAPNFAHAADIATIDCIANELPAPARAAFVEAGRRSALGDRSDPASFEAALDPYRAALRLCAARHKWSEKAADAANTYTISSFVLEGTLIEATPEGITAGVIETALAKLSPQDRAQLLDGDGDFMPLIDALVEDGFELKQGNQATLVGAVTGSMLMRDQARALFIAS